MGWFPKWDKEREVYLLPEALEVLKALPQHQKAFGKIPVRDGEGIIIHYEFKRANFVFPKKEIRLNGEKEVCYTRVDSVDTAWGTMRKKAGLHNLQLKDLRTYFNWILVNQYQLSHKLDFEHL